MTEPKPTYKADPTMHLPSLSSMTLAELLYQIDLFEYACPGGALKTNAAWMELKRRAAIDSSLDKAVVMAAELFEAAMDYYEGKIVYAELLQRLMQIVEKDDTKAVGQ